MGAVALTLVVATGRTQALDERLFSLFRPGDQWATGQVVTNEVVWLLGPVHVLALTMLVATLAARRQRSWRPLVITVGVVMTTVALVESLQSAIGRLDTHGDYLGGSYPSGHTVAATTAAGLLVLVHQHSGTLVRTLAAAGGATAVIGVALLVQGSHWATDVFGAGLLGVVVLSTAWAIAVPRHADQA